MKSTKLFLLVSVAASVIAISIGFWLRDSRTPRSSNETSFSSESADKISSGVSEVVATSRTVLSPAALRDRLRALGFPEDAVRAAIRAELASPRWELQRSYLAQAAAATPWWQGGIVAQNFTREQTRELRAMRSREDEELVRLFGPAGAVTSTEIEKFAYLPAEKAARLAALERDYADLRRAASEGGVGPLPTAGVEERLQLLAEEYQRDLTALLSPEERFEVELRRSETSRNLASRLAYFDATPEEIRTIYALQKAWDEKYSPRGLGGTPQEHAERVEATKKLQDDFRAALGDERFARWQRSVRLDYRTLVQAKRRFNLPQETFDAAVKIPVQLGEKANRILDHPVLRPDEKKAALAQLANEGRDQIRTLLGDEIGNAYLSASGRVWIDHLDAGRAYTLSSNGASVRTIPDMPSPFAPAPVLPPPPKS